MNTRTRKGKVVKLPSEDSKLHLGNSLRGRRKKGEGKGRLARSAKSERGSREEDNPIPRAALALALALAPDFPFSPVYSSATHAQASWRIQVGVRTTDRRNINCQTCCQTVAEK